MRKSSMESASLGSSHDDSRSVDVNSTHAGGIHTSQGAPVDCVIVYDDPTVDTDGPIDADEQGKAQARDYFENRLRDFHGLIVERVKATDVSKKSKVYVLISVPFERLCAEAEYLQLNKPLKHTDGQYSYIEIENISRSKLLHKIRNFFKLFIRYVKDYRRDRRPYSDFRKDHLERYAGSDDPDTFFLTKERIEMVFSILMHSKCRTPDGTWSKGVQTLVAKGCYLCVYPLHAAPTNKQLSSHYTKHNELADLERIWARTSCLLRLQPINRIRDYFGEQVAYYFEWLGFYTIWLIVPAIVGFFCFIYGLVYAFNGQILDDICTSQTKICAFTEMDEAYTLSSTCAYARFSAVFDNDATIYFTLFMGLWGVFFTEYWKRKSAVKAYKWNMVDFEEEELPRANFKGNRRAINPATGRMEPYYSQSTRSLKITGSLLTMAFMILIVLALVFGVIIYRLALQTVLYKKGDEYRDTGPLIVSSTAAVINLVGILIMSEIYNGLAVRLTEWENHRTQTAYENALTFKLYVFNFVNNYASIFYIAFFKGKFVGRPTAPAMMFGVPVEGCSPSGCMAELTIQLLIIMCGRQLFSAVVEIGLPWIMSWFNIWSSRQQIKEQSAVVKQKDLPQWEMDYYLNEYPGLSSEYMELVIQFGFLSLFVTALPLAPLFGFINNIFEIRLDAVKFIRTYRRPPTLRAQGIGTWATIIAVLVHLAAFTNGAIIAFTTDYVARQRYLVENNSLQGYVSSLYSYSPPTVNFPNGTQVDCYFKGYYDNQGNFTLEYYKQTMAQLAFLIIYEFVVLCTMFLAAYCIPDQPMWLTIAHKKKFFDAKRHLLGYQYDENLDDESEYMQDELPPELHQGPSSSITK